MYCRLKHGMESCGEESNRLKRAWYYPVAMHIQFAWFACTPLFVDHDN